jgi:hypothetical protein
MRSPVSPTDPPSQSPPAPSGKAPRSWRVWATAAAAIIFTTAAIYVALNRPPDPPPIPFFDTPLNVVRPALPYRIVSFHRGRADKNLIRLAAQLGFNGVQFQIEGSNEDGIKDFAARDRKEHLIDFCHSLGLKVTVWVHELSDLPTATSPAYLGDVAVDNDKLWNVIDARYEWILGTALPKIDGLVLTTVETQVNATDTPLMTKLVSLIDRKCRQHGKSLIVRTFVWRPDELEGVMGTVRQLPDDIVIMSKVVPQDWQMRGENAAEIGAVGNHPQIVEYDVAGEYFLSSNVANCMVELLKKQFDYGLTKNVQGICVRVDRYDASIIWEPNEVNLWTLGLLAAGNTDNTDDIWRRWAAYRYGSQAAPAVIAALKPTADVVAEMLSLGPFTFGDTRGYGLSPVPEYLVPEPYEDILSQNWQMWRWDDKFVPEMLQAAIGHPQFLDQIRAQKSAAQKIADQCLTDLEAAKPFLPDREYRILRTKLLTNTVQLYYRNQAALAALHWRQLFTATAPADADRARTQYQKDLAAVAALANALKELPPPKTLNYLGKRWPLNYPFAITADQIDQWTDLATQAVEPPATP